MQAAGSVSISGILDRVLQRRRWAHIVETRMGRGFPGDLRCCVACERGWPFAAQRVVQLIPENLRRSPEGLDQRFLRSMGGNVTLTRRPVPEAPVRSSTVAPDPWAISRTMARPSP